MFRILLPFFCRNFYNELLVKTRLLFSMPYLIWMRNLKTSENTSKNFAPYFFNDRNKKKLTCFILNLVT